MLTWTEYRNIRKTQFGENRTESKYNYKHYLKAKMNINIPYIAMDGSIEMTTYSGSVNTFSLAPLDYPQAVPCQEERNAPQKGNNPMYVDNDKHIESSKINYLMNRAEGFYYSAQEKVADAFNLRTPKHPATPEDLVAAITSGNYTIPPKTERNTYDRVTNQIIWRAPTIKADPEGADKATTEFKKLLKDAKDTIMIGTPTEGLAAVKALDAWTPTVGNA